MDPLLSKVDQCIASSTDPSQALRGVCEILSDLEGFDWVGFYLVDPEDPGYLVLGPFVGEPTEHTRIPVGRGICGQAAARRTTLVVDDVSQERNYLSCSPHVRSEIVVPVWWEGQVVGELDIDSHAPARFGLEQAWLEEVCRRVAPIVQELRTTQGRPA